MKQTGNIRRNGVAIGFMFTAVAGYPVIPLLVALSNGASSPFIFNAGLALGVGIGHLVFLWMFFRNVLLSTSVLSSAWRQIFSYSMLLIVIHRFEYGLFALATRFIDVSVASVIFEIRPITSLPVIAYLFRQEGRTLSKDHLRDAPVAGLSLHRVLLRGGQPDWSVEAQDKRRLFRNRHRVILVLMAVAVASFVAFTFRCGADFRETWPVDVVSGKNAIAVDISCVILASCIGALRSAVLNFAIGFGIGEPILPASMARLWWVARLRTPWQISPGAPPICSPTIWV